MARARNIKPGFFKNYDLADLGPHAQILFAGLWCLADKEGRLEDKPRLIKAEIFPYYEVDVNGELTKLARLTFIYRYQAEGMDLIEIPNFTEHQSPHHTEKASKLPARSGHYQDKPLDMGTPEINGGLTVDSRNSNGGNPPDSLIPDSLIPDSLIPDSLIPEVCAEPQSDSTPKVIDMPIVGGKEFPITEQHVAEWSSAYPAVDVVRQLAAMRQWCLANPTRKKTARGVLAFCNAWLIREQDKPKPAARPAQQGYESERDRSRRETAEALTGRKNNGQCNELIDIN